MADAQGRFKVAVQQQRDPRRSQGGTSFNLAAGAYALEREALDPIGAEIVEIPAETEDDFIEAARDADAVIARGRRITSKIIEGLDRCVVIGVGSVGTDVVDVDAATDAGIVVTNVPDVFIEEVADHAMALMLAAHRRLKQVDKLIHAGRWREGHPSLWDSPRLWGQTVGLIAFGNVARAFARRCQPFGLHVIAYDPYVGELTRTAEHVEPAGLMEMLERSDFVSMHTPLNDETRHMMSTDQFKAMKPTAIFINTGRGETVDEAALIDALEQGEIAAAAIDVMEKEPPDPENPLLHMDNVVVTPHIGSASSRMMPETRRRLGHEIAAALLGRWPRSAVNPSVLPRTKLRRWQPYPMVRGPNR